MLGSSLWGQFKSGAGRALDPRRSLVAGAISLIFALALTFSIAAAVWVGGIARENLLEQHVRRLSLETDQLSSDLAQTLTAHLGAVRTAGAILRAADAPGGSGDLSDVFAQLVSAYPQFDWLAIADNTGFIVNASDASKIGTQLDADPWLEAGRHGTWIGKIEDLATSVRTFRGDDVAALGDIAMPLRDRTGMTVGVIAAHLSWRRSPNHPLRLTDEVGPAEATQACVLNRDGIVLVGPRELRNHPWNGRPFQNLRLGSSDPDSSLGVDTAPQFERLPNGRLVLVARAPLNVDGDLAPLGLLVQLSEPKERVYQRADAVASRILWASLGLGAATALIGALGARQLTRRLKRLTLSVASTGRSNSKIDVPKGRDEVAQLGAAFATLVNDLERERSELKSLSNELERRVSVRTKEVERLAEESRYAAMVRERLKIARDLHDTLAHSMMAILSEIRFLRKLQIGDPAAVVEELARAERLAHEGLQEARAAITQMRGTAVRETGLGPALANAVERFTNLTGLSSEFSAEVDAAGFGDERAETLVRMTAEALRNIERHARATRVTVRLQSITKDILELRIEDNGVGFDPLEVPPGHYGLVGLREQALLIGAELRIDSRPNEGTIVLVSLRLSPTVFNQIDKSVS
jgi:signal transduction histidine kinase